MFEIYEYEKNFYGLSIARNVIELGDENYLNSLKKIKFDKREKELYILAFSLISLEQLQIYKNLFNEELILNKNITLSKLVDNLAEQFDKINDSNKINEYLGLITELCFIKKCQLSGIDIIKNYQVQNDHFDFKLDNGKFIEIKKVRKSDKTILISHKQLQKLNDEDLVIGIDLYLDSQGMSLIDLFESISFKDDKQKQYVDKRIKSILDDNSFHFEKWNIDVEKSDFYIIQKRYLPIIENKLNNLLVDAQYRNLH